MIPQVSRRDFISAGGAAALALALPRGVSADAPAKAKIRKSLMFGMVPQLPTVEERMKLAKDAGFEGIEADTMDNPADVAAMKAASEKLGVAVEAIVCNKHWSHPLSSPDPKIADVCMEAMRTS
ncbi:twin-arginine translocation signal domain-containing protein, partial [Candidatus Sumerlaeota bacterium]|nr:twin-arginine translocation signal domain-containing protein [Candidatus Sumerlaeota bacterium]